MQPERPNTYPPLGSFKLKGEAWLEHHLEKFVKPYLGSVPELGTHYDTRENYIPTMVEVWEQVKKECGQRTMLLAGRDVWEFEILARLEGYPSLFRPDISSTTYSYLHKHEPKLQNCYLLDTGNRGSVPKGLKIDKYRLLYCSIQDEVNKHQVFPEKFKDASYTSQGSYYNLYCWLEGTNKYWTSAIRNYTKNWAKIAPGIYQQLSPKSEFIGAARLCQFIAREVLKRKKSTARLGKGRI